MTSEPIAGGRRGNMNMNEELDGNRRAVFDGEDVDVGELAPDDLELSDAEVEDITAGMNAHRNEYVPEEVN